MLGGIRVLDLTREPGFLAGKILGDCGADVIKIEPPGGDLEARRGPFVGGFEDPDRSLPWLAMNTSKRGITLSLEKPRGRELFAELARRADVVLESERPGRLDERGIGYRALRERHPRLVWCAITPFGQTGPWAGYRAQDLVVVALGGNASGTGDPDRPPLRCTLPTAYLHAGPEAATGIAMALFARERTGRGQLVDVSLHECQLATLMTGPGQVPLWDRLPERSGARLGRTREIWPAADGDVSFGLRGGPARIPNLVATVRWMSEEGVAPEWLEKYDWQGYDHSTLSDAEIARLEEAFGAFFAAKTRRELYEGALARRIMLAPCNDAREILAQPQLRHRRLFTTVDYPVFETEFEHPDSFAKASRGRIGIRSRAPLVGEHNAQVYGEIGLRPADLRSLAREGVV